LTNIYKRKKGFSFIELILALAISSMVLSIIYAFYISNLKTNTRTETRSQLQYEGENFIKSVSKYAMQANGIAQILGTNGNAITGGTLSSNISIISFNYPTSIDDATPINASYTYDSTSRIVNISMDSGATQKILCKYVDSISVQTLDGAASYNDTNGIKITISLSKDGESYTLSDNLYFRNK
jgi:prepilin-type N-terminal cleavage/methylation domain